MKAFIVAVSRTVELYHADTCSIDDSNRRESVTVFSNLSRYFLPTNERRLEEQSLVDPIHFREAFGDHTTLRE
jgi:hypothetical protein